ncbi:MAG: hypothetical protein ACP5E9_08085 [Candidatus Methanospirareceae archaeon]
MKLERALERYKKGGISLARLAELADSSIREMIPLAYAQGLEPKYDEGSSNQNSLQKPHARCS